MDARITVIVETTTIGELPSVSARLKYRTLNVHRGPNDDRQNEVLDIM